MGLSCTSVLSADPPGTDERSDRRLIAAEPSGERGADLRIGEIELGGAHRRVIHGEDRFRLSLRARALVVGVLRQEAVSDQRRAAIEIGPRIFQRRLVA
jgi:hypothetical protein